MGSDAPNPSDAEHSNDQGYGDPTKSPSWLLNYRQETD